MKPILEALKWLFQNLYHVAENAIESAKKYSKIYLKALVRMFLIAVIVPLTLFLFGAIFDLRWIIALSGIFGAIAMLALLILATPLGILIETVLNGPSGSGQRYVRGASGILLFILCFSFFGSLLPISQNLPTIPLLIVGALILSLLNTWLFRREIVGFIVGLIFLGLVLSFYFPLTFSDFGQKISDLDFYVGKPKLAKVTLQQIQQRQIEFFRPDGKPRYWYYVNRDRQIELYDHEGVHPTYREELKPLTPDIVKHMERQLFTVDSLRASQEAQAADKRAIAERTRLAETQRKQAATQAEKGPTRVSARPLPMKTEPSLSPGMRFTYKQKSVPWSTWYGWYKVTLHSIELLEGMFIQATLAIENTDNSTSRGTLLDPDKYAFVTNQTGTRSPFISSEHFPDELPPGIPIRFTLTFNRISPETRVVFISFRFAPLRTRGQNLDEPLYDHAKDVVIRDIKLE